MSVRVRHAEVLMLNRARRMVDVQTAMWQVQWLYGTGSPEYGALAQELEALRLQPVPDQYVKQVLEERARKRQPHVGGTYWKADGTPVIVSPFERPNA